MNKSLLGLSVILLGFVALFVPSVPASAAPPDSGNFPAIAEALKPFIADNEITGAVTLVATKDRIVHLAAIGESDSSAHTPMKPDAIFWIASMTKPLTGTAILMLQDEQKLSIEDPVAKFIPDFANIKTPSGKPANLTLRHLLTHTSGLSEATVEQQKAAKTLSDLIPHFVDKPTKFEPGEKWMYCQSGINTLGRIIEIASGQPLPDFLEKRITGPLGMRDTTFYPSKAQQARTARTYSKSKETGKLEPAIVSLFAGLDLADTGRVPLANGGLYSTASDYARFCQMLLNNGALDGRIYLRPESIKLMSSILSGDVKTGFTPGNGWGTAVCVVREPQGVTAMLSPGTFGHGGAYGTQAWIDPVKGVAYVLMVQRQNFANSDASDVRKTFQQAAVDAMK
ncbi:MAG: penicillin-binding protein beta-lactamase class [Phycisphaerales bacterium]|nr:penicillin-binding protein beta-lactamase class [Phycisphaerales bacterium]